jgi:hypothetical protein
VKKARVCVKFNFMSFEPDFKSKFNSSAEVLHKLLEDKAGPVSDQYLRWKLWLAWKDVVGVTVSENSEPIAYHRGILTLCVRNSVWMTQMNFMKEPIMNSVNQKFKSGFVKEIRLTLDRRQTPSQADENFRSQVQKFVKK